MLQTGNIRMSQVSKEGKEGFEGWLKKNWRLWRRAKESEGKTRRKEKETCIQVPILRRCISIMPLTSPPKQTHAGNHLVFGTIRQTPSGLSFFFFFVTFLSIEISIALLNVSTKKSTQLYFKILIYFELSLRWKAVCYLMYFWWEEQNSFFLIITPILDYMKKCQLLFILDLVESFITISKVEGVKSEFPIFSLTSKTFKFIIIRHNTWTRWQE